MSDTTSARNELVAAYQLVLQDVSLRHERSKARVKVAEEEEEKAPKGMIVTARREAEHRRATEWRLRQVVNYLVTYFAETANMSDEGYRNHLSGEAHNGRGSGDRDLRSGECFHLLRGRRRPAS